MTEISEDQMQALFGGPPPMTPAQAEHARKVHQATYDAQMLAYAQVQFFAPILCDCEPGFAWGAPRPPQLGCVVHGHIQTDEHGAVLLFAPPKKW